MGSALRTFADKVPGFLYPHRYRLFIYGRGDSMPSAISDSNTLSLLCTSAALPRDTVKTVSINWNGETVNYPLKMQSGQTWSCIILENTEGEVIKEVEEFLLAPVPFIVTVAVIPVNDMGEAVYPAGIEMHYAYLTTSTPPQLTSDSIHTFEWGLIFAYAYTRRITV